MSELAQQTSPHMGKVMDTAYVMRQVLLATLPGILVLTALFGWGTLINLLWASAFACLFEAICMRLRGRPIAFYLLDYSALVTAVLLGIALPPAAPWWLIGVGMFFSIVVAKHLYGGLGYNPFNPAMVGYVVLLISFPVEMTRWFAPLGSAVDQSLLGPLEALRLSLTLIDSTQVDALTMATPLDIFRQNTSLMNSELFDTQVQFGLFGGRGWEWVNVAFLCGGLYLLKKGIFSWHAPLSMIFTLAVMSMLFYEAGSSASKGSPLFHLFTGATMFVAFFIVTDPVTSAVSQLGRLYYGAFIGIITFFIRAYGNYPDAFAFAILLMNFAAPFIDHYTQPKTYGHASQEKRREPQ